MFSRLFENHYKYVVSRAVSGALLDAVKVAHFRALIVQNAFLDDSCN